MNVKEEKGSMAVYVTIVLVSMLLILSTSFLIINELRKQQINTSLKVKEAYEKDLGRADIIYEKVNTPFEPGPTPEPETGGTPMSNMTNGVIEIKWLDGTSYNVSDSPNAPVTKTISNGTMELVKFDSSSKTWVSGTEYSYIAGTGSSDNTQSKWANAKVTINDVDSYFVWIPRYAYRIIYFKDATSKTSYQEGTLTEKDAVANGKIIGYSDSRGIVDAHGKKIDGVASTTKVMVSKDYFMVHPAFMDGKLSGYENGEWNEELSGIWIGKYDTSGNSSELKVQPGESSLRNTTIGNMYTYSKLYQPELKSHMLKNSEWGAVAYLTESSYGRNGTEISQNRNSDYKTGGGTETAYFDTNKLQSSTGNEYGIYDLSGGQWKFIAAYYKDGKLDNGESIVKDSNNGYSTVYSGTNITEAYKYGDATYETGRWHSDDYGFIDVNSPFFRRSGTFYDGNITGVFYFSKSYGESNGNAGFRLALCM